MFHQSYMTGKVYLEQKKRNVHGENINFVCILGFSKFSYILIKNEWVSLNKLLRMLSVQLNNCFFVSRNQL